jgi:hypothetical protein
MRIIFLIAFSFIINIYAQFTSGTDYSGRTEETVKPSVMIGTAVYSERSDIKWEPSRTGDLSFSASSNLTGFGYGLFAEIPTGKFMLSLAGDHIFKDISNSASRSDYAGEDIDPVFSRIDVPDRELTEIRGKAGIEFHENYKLAAQVLSLSDTKDANSLQLGGYAEYSTSRRNGRKFRLFYEMNSKGEEEFLSEAVNYSAVRPLHRFGAGFETGSDISGFNSTLTYLNYDESVTGGRSSGYLNLDIMYERYISNANTKVSVSAGGNLSDEFKSPEIYLPYFYYNIMFATDFYDSRIELNIGWNYGLYNSILSGRMSIPSEDMETLPAGTSELSEDAGSYILDIKLSYRF